MGHPLISRLTIRRRRLTIRKFQLTPATRTRSSGSAHALRTNRNLPSSFFFMKIWMSSHGRYQICPRSPREVIEHKLDIDPSYKPIKQKERRYTPERHETN
jgi:hypothetical protein